MIASRFMHVLQFLMRELLDALLRPLWINDTAAFEGLLNRTDCYPFRVCYDLGECRQMWIQGPGEVDNYEEDFS